MIPPLRNQAKLIKLLLMKPSFLHRIKRVIQYTNLQSNTVTNNCFFGNGMLCDRERHD